MENKENTHPIPEPENIKGEEENPITAEDSAIAETNETPDPPTVKAVTEEAPSEISSEESSTGSNGDEPPDAGKEEAKQPEITVSSDTPHPDETDDESDEHAEEEQDHPEPGEDYDAYTREQLVELLEQAVHEEDINSVKTKIALIKVAFLKKNKEENINQYEKMMTEEEQKEASAANLDPIEAKFNEYFSIYKANKARYSEELEKQKQENLRKKNQILEELKQLIGSEETLKKTYDEFRTLQERWKEIGMVPRNEINNLWQNYHFLVEKFFEKVKLNKELKDLDLKKNMEAKIALCEKTEELLLETSILKSFKRLQKYHEEWKEIGPVPLDKKEEIWERFKNATDKINDRRREHYARIEEEQVKNLETKTALCEQAETFLSGKYETIREWQESTGQMNELLKIWKSVGTVPQKHNTEIWNRFKTCLDTYFSSKKDFFDKLKEQQFHNYNMKVELCLQAEAMKSNTDWKKTTMELIRLQNEWKKIGPVPKKHSDKIWKRFRAACDEFFTAKAAYFSNLQSHEEENLKLKLALIERLKEYAFTEDKNENLEILKNFQREWTEIGHIPIKEKDRLQNEFRAIINQQLDKLKISEVEMSTVTYQTKVDSLKHNPQARKLIGREREQLTTRIIKMKEDLSLWENNIGFLANSKNAAILREEFEKKISKAKSDLKVMEAKLKILRS